MWQQKQPRHLWLLFNRCVCVWRAQHIWILDYYSWCYQSKQVGSQVPLMKWTDRRQYQIYRYHIQNEKSELQMDLKILLGPDFSVIKICNNNFIKTIFNNKCKQFLISAPLMHPIKWWSNSQIIMYFLIILPFIEKATLILLNYTFFFFLWIILFNYTHPINLLTVGISYLVV
jgi:hypothetical protein